MKEMRPFQVIILVVFVIAALGGLLLFANFKGFGRNADQVGTVAIWGTLSSRDIAPVLAEFKKAHKEYGKVTYAERSAATFDADLANAIASGTGPDLIVISQEQLFTEQARLSVVPFASLSERTFRDSYLPVFDIFLSETGTYGIPLVVDPLVMYYNRTLLTSAGVPLAPTTWEAVAGLASVMTIQNQAQTITRSAIPLGTYGNIENARAILSLLFLQSGRSITLRTGQGIRSDITKSGGETYGSSAPESAINFYSEFASPSKTVYTWNRSLPNSRQVFTVGDVALYLGFASEAKGLQAANPNLDFDMARVPQPGTATVRSTFGRAYVFAIPLASKNSAGAYEVALAFSGPEMLPMLARSLGMAPARRALLAPSGENIYEPVYYPEALAAKGWLSPAPSVTDAIFGGMIDNVNSGRMSVKQALVTADQALNALFY